MNSKGFDESLIGHHKSNEDVLKDVEEVERKRETHSRTSNI
jgi:hypothetical protein